MFFFLHMRRFLVPLGCAALAMVRRAIQQDPLDAAPTPADVEPIQPEAAAEVVPPSQRRHEKLAMLAMREMGEELRRTDKPPLPICPKGWTIAHEPGHNYFWLKRKYTPRHGSEEELRIYAQLEIKEPEATYSFSDGERDIGEHLTFWIFINKPSCPEVGGLEFVLTSVDAELAIDGLAVHSTNQDFAAAVSRDWKALHDRNQRYRGPYIAELDEDFSDEISAYLEERGITNNFADFIMALAHYIEQDEYENWLQLLDEFSH